MDYDLSNVRWHGFSGSCLDILSRDFNSPSHVAKFEIQAFKKDSALELYRIVNEF